MKRRSFSLVLAAAFATSEIAVAQPPQAAIVEADHIALRKLKADALTAINTQDFDRVRQLTHEPFMATVVTQDSFNDFDQLVGFYKSLYTTDHPDRPRMKKVSIAAEADELSQIYTGTFAITRGSTLERYELADGRGFDLNGRWTGVSIKDGGEWKMLAVHTGTNFLNNPVLQQYEKAVKWVGGGALGAGLLIGFLLGRLLRRRARPNDAGE